MRQEIKGFWDDSGISWTICKQSASYSEQTTTPTPHHSIFTGWMLFLMPNQQCQSTEGHKINNNNKILLHTHQFNGPFPGLPRSTGTRKVKPIWITEARDSEWQWHQLGHMQVCTSLQTDNHASTPPLSFLQAGCPSCRPTNSVKALKD